MTSDEKTWRGYRGGYNMMTLHYFFVDVIGWTIFLPRYLKCIGFKFDWSSVRSLLSRGLREGFVKVVYSVRYILSWKKALKMHTKIHVLGEIRVTCLSTYEVDTDSEEDLDESHSDAINDEDSIPLITDILWCMESPWDD